MTEQPAPLTPADCDLRSYEWMPLDVNRLLTSETWVLGTAEECKASVTLWCEAWRQVPAASLPDDDRMLAHLSRLGPAWKRVREAVMRSWVKCSDGRLYHPVVAEKARWAWEQKLAQIERTKAATEARRRRREGLVTNESPPTMQRDDNVTRNDTKDATLFDTSTSRSTSRSPKEKNREEKKRTYIPSSLRSEGPHSAADASPPPKRGSRLPTDWEPSEADRVFALDLGLPVARIAAQFRDYWHAAAGQSARKLDWSATWRNWCRREAENPAYRASAPPARTLRETDHDHNQAAIERLQRELLGQPEPDFFAGSTIEGTIQ